MNSNTTTKSWKPFVVGGFAAITAGAATHPIDLIKVRTQVAGEATHTATGDLLKKFGKKSVFRQSLQVSKNLWGEEGIRGFYSGLSAALCRQGTYSTIRFGIYGTLKKKLSDGKGEIPLHKKVGASLFAGSIGALFGTPFDVVLVRMQADSRLPLSLRRNYSSVFGGIWDIYWREGALSLWRGCMANVQRAALVTCGQMSSYDTFKELFVRKGMKPDHLGTHVCASMCAGGIVVALASPVDVVKSRMMSSSASSTASSPSSSSLKKGGVEYKNTFHCVRNILKYEGWRGFYSGWLPYYARVGPHVVILFVAFEQLNSLFS